MIFHALVPQCALSVLSYSECKIAKIFRGFAPRAQWGELTAPPDSQLHNGFSARYSLRKTVTPPLKKKLLNTAL